MCINNIVYGLKKICKELTTPPWFVRAKKQLSAKEYYENSLESAKRCCPQLNKDDNISGMSFLCFIYPSALFNMYKYLVYL